MLVCRGQAGLLADDDDEVEDIAPIVMEDFGEEEHDARLSSVVKVSTPLTPFPSFLPTEIAGTAFVEVDLDVVTVVRGAVP